MRRLARWTLVLTVLAGSAYIVWASVAVHWGRLTGRNGFGGRSGSEAWVAVPGPWFRLDGGPWMPLAAWR